MLWSLYLRQRQKLSERVPLCDAQYADDTIFLGASPKYGEEYAQAVQAAGARFGLALHWGKTQALSIGNGGRLQKPDGTTFESADFIEYLGGLIQRDGRADWEISRKLGRASGDFRLLRSVWSHSGVARGNKVRFFEASALSRLAYWLSTQWLVSAQRRRLDRFATRCLRRVLGIPPAIISRVSNDAVFACAGLLRFSYQLLKQQLQFFGKVALTKGSPLRTNIFVDNTLQPQIGRLVRKVGRPFRTGQPN